MQTVNTQETALSTLYKLAKQDTVAIASTSHEEPEVVALSAKRYQALLGDWHKRFMSNRDAIADHAHSQGLTDDKIDDLLASLDD